MTEPVVTRIAGDGRCETAIQAANTLKEELGVEKFDSIILASGLNFADALAGSYLAAVKDAPILLHLDSRLQMNLIYILSNLKSGGTVYILGGDSAVPTNVETMLRTYNINVVRLAGQDRFATNIEILKEAGVNPGDEILVATGFNFADSLSASATGKPILLVNSVSNKLSDAQFAYLLSLGFNNKLTILGGTSAVSDTLATLLSSFGTVDRLAGESRYDTSVMIAERYFPNADTVVLAYGGNFPDGLSGGPVAYSMTAPLILTQKGKESIAAAFIAEKNIYIGYVMGGTSAIPESTVNKLFDMD